MKTCLIKKFSRHGALSFKYKYIYHINSNVAYHNTNPTFNTPFSQIWVQVLPKLTKNQNARSFAGKNGRYSFLQ